MYDPNQLLGEKEDIGITVALIPADTKGVKVGRRHNPLHVPFQNGPVQGEDVFIPLSYIIGGQTYAGQGWRMLMESLAAGRAISLPALSCGTGKMACAVTSAYVKVREQFGIPIGRFEGVSERVASIVMATYTVEAVRRLSARAVDLGERPSVLSAIAKYNTTEAMRGVINDAMDVAGGKGIIVGPKNLLAHVYMAIPVGITVEGANILTRSMIVFGQGSIRCNPHILAEIEGIYNPDAKQGVMQFDQAFFAHIYSLGAGVLRALRFSWFAWIPSTVPSQTKLSNNYHQVNRLSALFSMVADLSLVTLGGKLKQKESLSGRLADALSGLYQASAVLKLYADHHEPEEEELVVQAAVTHELVRVEHALDRALVNFPNVWVGRILRLMVFPFGLKHQPVRDDVLHQLTKSVMENGGLRQALVKGIYFPQDKDQAMAQMEAALKETLKCEPMVVRLREEYGRNAVKAGMIAQTVQQALQDKMISEDETKQLEAWLELRYQVVAVDDFDVAEMTS
jgi:acyl-CoA dehydrogenase